MRIGRSLHTCSALRLGRCASGSRRRPWKPHRDERLLVPEDEQLIALANRATETKRWRGALPIGEPLDSAIDPPALPAKYSIVAGDGSQIYPDSHGIALYYLINIGTIVFRHGSGQAPIANSAALTAEGIQLEDRNDFDGAGAKYEAER